MEKREKRGEIRRDGGSEKRERRGRRAPSTCERQCLSQREKKEKGWREKRREFTSFRASARELRQSLEQRKCRGTWRIGFRREGRGNRDYDRAQIGQFSFLRRHDSEILKSDSEEREERNAHPAS